MVYLSVLFDWRAAFIVIGMFGILWVAVWLVLTRRVPALDRGSSSPGAPVPNASEDTTSLSTWPEILSSTRFWGLIVASVFGNPCYYFYSTWLATYFVQQRAMSFGAELGKVMMIPYLGLGLGSMLGGVPVFCLTRRGWEIVRARKVTLVFSSILTLPAVAVSHTRAFSTALIIIIILTVGMGAWIANYISALQDLSQRHVASVAGIVGSFGAFAGGLGMSAVGLISSTHYGFGPVFVALAVMPIIASLGVILPRSPTLQRLRATESEALN